MLVDGAKASRGLELRKLDRSDYGPHNLGAIYWDIIMRLRTLLCSTLVCPLALVAGEAKNSPAPTPSASEIPHLRKQGTATQLIVDGEPFLALAGELGNNTATSLEYLKQFWPKLVATRLNSVLAAVSWAQIEPEEGKFDFTVLDGVIRDARTHHLRLVLLWFASWKNGGSTYPPDWVKRQFERFPRAQIAEGRGIELLSPFSEANRDADARAFAALMRHVREVDGQQHTVVMVQVENEIGMSGGGRDLSPAARKTFAEPVPKELMDYLQEHHETLIPELREVWASAGFKKTGTWAEVFGPGFATDEIFMAWHFARYIDRVAAAGKAEYPLPMFVNGWVPGFPKVGQRPNAQCGSPMPDVLDVWRAGAPHIDMLTPDIYDYDFAEMCARYTRSGNPLFIPETRGLPPAGLEARVLYAFGRHDAIGFSPMGIERPAIPDIELVSVYDVIAQLAPLISTHQGDGTMSAVLLRWNDPPQKIRVGNYTLEASFRKPRVLPGSPVPQEPFPSAAAIFIATGPDEFFAAGNGVNVIFSPNTPGPEFVGLATVEEGVFVGGRWVPGRRLAGDDTGDQNLVLARLHEDAGHPALFGPSMKGIQRVTLNRYR